ncbi:MAG TPA: maleylpyruvate isomerase family mycothiol-dependent enzyme [Jatrophihabitans sp.]|nr:maleylpyruvate isomerase family mycothiol-dependent enzyme [Jatrophihabitans sp.]
MYNQLYLDSQRRVADLISPLSAAELDRRTPACPHWSVRDVLAHLADSSASFPDSSALVADSSVFALSAATFAACATDQAAELFPDSGRARPVAELLASWQRHLPEVTQIPVSSQSWLPILHEALSHEADIRGAIGAPLLPADVLAAAWPLLTDPIARRLAPLGTVLLRLDEQPIMLGDGTPDVEVVATQFDFWRAWFGRRSRAQIAGWVRVGDPAGLAELLPVVPPRDTDLIEIG